MGEDGIARQFQVTLGNTLFNLSHTIMPKPRILLVTSQHLFGESMETILRAESDMELVGPWNLGDQDLCGRLQDIHPSVVVIADENLQSKAATELTQSIIERYPELTVIRTALNDNVFRTFSTHTLPARGADLLDTIRSCVVWTGKTAKSDESISSSGVFETYEKTSGPT
jgi:DNA-binding NarL/FixJ family response regulator